ncbi:unnamed protein product [Urochloa humidicola]
MAIFGAEYCGLKQFNSQTLTKRDTRTRCGQNNAPMSLALVPAPMTRWPSTSGLSCVKAPRSRMSLDGPKKRGRPKGTTNKKHMPALGTAGLTWITRRITAFIGTLMPLSPPSKMHKHA